MPQNGVDPEAVPSKGRTAENVAKAVQKSAPSFAADKRSPEKSSRGSLKGPSEQELREFMVGVEALQWTDADKRRAGFAKKEVLEALQQLEDPSFEPGQMLSREGFFESMKQWLHKERAKDVKKAQNKKSAI